jgi:hypothetical protein
MARRLLRRILANQHRLVILPKYGILAQAFFLLQRVSDGAFQRI